MKKIFFAVLTVAGLGFYACGSNSGSGSMKDSAAAPGPDSAANNAIVPPSGAPGNANNSSLADTTYKSKDSNKIHKDTSGIHK